MPAGKRLAPMLGELVPILRRFGERDIDEDTATLLVGMSAATIDRERGAAVYSNAAKGSSLCSDISRRCDMAGVQAIESKTFLPEQTADLAPVLSFLSAHEQRRGRTVTTSYALVGADEHDRVELPREVHQALRQVVAALHAGKAVTVAPQSMTLTTQQAADLLGVSRPTVVRLITSGELAADRIGNRHRLVLDDVLAYREARRKRQYDALAETAMDIDADEDPNVIYEQLREARRVVADAAQLGAAPDAIAACSQPCSTRRRFGQAGSATFFCRWRPKVCTGRCDRLPSLRSSNTTKRKSSSAVASPKTPRRSAPAI